jgi:hypothetical protein
MRADGAADTLDAPTLEDAGPKRFGFEPRNV